MKKLFLLSAVFSLIVVACNSSSNYQKIAGNTQGTTYHITYNGDVLYNKEIDSILNVIDINLSYYNEKALLYRVNQNEDLPLTDHFVKVFNAAMDISKASFGRYDITVGPLIKMYGFGGTKKADTITDAMIDSILQFVGYQKVKIVNNKLVKSDPRIQLDMNSIAQGYTCDVVGDFFERHGINNYLIEIGGEILVKGQNELGDLWHIAVEKPIENTDITDRKVELVLGVKNQKLGIATSGNYRKYYVEYGVKFTHSIDAKTGKPLRDSLLSVTIIAKDGMTADGYATACMVSGYENAKKIIKNQKLEAFMVYLDKKGNYQLYFTPGFKKLVIEENEK